jgi:hypothetical protein
MANIRSPFQGRPKTRQSLHAKDGLTFTVIPNELTPLRARAADISAGLSAFGLLLAGFHFSKTTLHNPPDWIWLVLLFAAYGSYYCLKPLWRFLYRTETRIVMTATRFSYRVWYGWKHFDRTLPHKFVVLQHDKAKREQEKHQLDLRNGRGQQEIKTRYYGESFHIVFEYVGQRNDVLTVFGQKEALAVAARLKACDGACDAQAKLGDGLALGPQDQWGDQPGDIE